MTKSVYVVKTGTANIGSITSALKRVGGIPTVGDDPSLIRSSELVVVPGVGTFGAAMELIQVNGCEEAIKERIREEKPTFFICVGMQILATTSQESPGAKGLGIIPTEVSMFPDTVTVPQHGWNRVAPSPGARYIEEGFAYFSNSYKFSPSPSGFAPFIPSLSNHGGLFLAALEHKDIVACQFHPELSGPWGLSLLRRWIESSPGKAVSSQIDLLADPSLNTLKTHRIIPCLDVKNGKVVKGIKFQELKEVGDPAQRAALYQEEGADELVVLDISATDEARSTRLETVRAVRSVLSIPLTVGGGVSSVETAHEILLAGADKVAVNTAAVKDPQILTRLANRFGRQCTVLSLDAVHKGPGSWEVVISAGKERTGKDAVVWAKEAEQLGCGEILLTSWDRDGTGSGYDVELIQAVSSAVSVPVIASGGASSSSHLLAAFSGGADAVLAASIFHYGDTTATKVKEDLRSNNISVRL